MIETAATPSSPAKSRALRLKITVVIAIASWFTHSEVPASHKAVRNKRRAHVNLPLLPHCDGHEPRVYRSLYKGSLDTRNAVQAAFVRSSVFALRSAG